MKEILFFSLDIILHYKNKVEFLDSYIKQVIEHFTNVQQDTK